MELSPAPALPGALGAPSRLKSNSDPSIATQDDIAAPPPPYSTTYQVSYKLLVIVNFNNNLIIIILIKILNKNLNNFKLNI